MKPKRPSQRDVDALGRLIDRWCDLYAKNATHDQARHARRVEREMIDFKSKLQRARREAEK